MTRVSQSAAKRSKSRRGGEGVAAVHEFVDDGEFEGGVAERGLRRRGFGGFGRFGGRQQAAQGGGGGVGGGFGEQADVFPHGTAALEPFHQFGAAVVRSVFRQIEFFQHLLLQGCDFRRAALWQGGLEDGGSVLVGVAVGVAVAEHLAEAVVLPVLCAEDEQCGESGNGVGVLFEVAFKEAAVLFGEAAQKGQDERGGGDVVFRLVVGAVAKIEVEQAAEPVFGAALGR